MTHFIKNIFSQNIKPWSILLLWFLFMILRVSIYGISSIGEHQIEHIETRILLYNILLLPFSIFIHVHLFKLGKNFIAFKIIFYFSLATYFGEINILFRIINKLIGS